MKKIFKSLLASFLAAAMGVFAGCSLLGMIGPGTGNSGTGVQDPTSPGQSQEESATVLRIVLPGTARSVYGPSDVSSYRVDLQLGDKIVESKNGRPGETCAFDVYNEGSYMIAVTGKNAKGEDISQGTISRYIRANSGTVTLNATSFLKWKEYVETLFNPGCTFAPAYDIWTDDANVKLDYLTGKSEGISGGWYGYIFYYKEDGVNKSRINGSAVTQVRLEYFTDGENVNFTVHPFADDRAKTPLTATKAKQTATISVTASDSEENLMYIGFENANGKNVYIQNIRFLDASGNLVKICPFSMLPASYDLSGYSINTKRGICFNDLNEAQSKLLSSGYVRHTYNWGSGASSVVYKYFNYYAMAWNTGGSGGVRNFLEANGTSHGDIVLGYNEPNMGGGAGGCWQLPSECAQHWPELEALADQYGVKLAGPAMTYGYETMSNGKVYNTPESWFDEFVQEYKNRNDGRAPRFDYFTVHQYSCWPGAVSSMIEEYYNRYGKPVLLTEFNAWGTAGKEWDWISSPHFGEEWEFKYMAQVLEYLDKSPKCAGYFWFNTNAPTHEAPWAGVVEGDGLSRAGKILAYMSVGDTGKYYSANGTGIPAVQYVRSCNGEASDPNGICFSLDSSDDENAGEIPLAIIGFINRRWAEWQVSAGEAGTYMLNVRIRTNGEQKLTVKSNGTEVGSLTVENTGNLWNSVSIPVNIGSGNQTIRIESSGEASDVRLNALWIKK